MKTALFAVILLTSVSSIAEDDLPLVLTDNQWDHYIEVCAEPTEQRIEEIKVWLRSYRDEVRAARRNENYTREQEARQVQWLREQRELLREELQALESGEAHHAPSILPIDELGDIGRLDVATVQKTRPEIRILREIDDRNMIIVIVWREAQYDGRFNIVGWVDAWGDPIWVRNDVKQVEDAQGSRPSLEGVFLVSSPVEYGGVQDGQRTITQVIAVDVEAESERRMESDE